MAGSEADRRGARTDIVPVVVGVGYVQMACIFRAIAVGMADERRLVVVVDIAVRDGNPVRSMRDVDETIVVILAVINIRRYIDVVNPDVGRCLNAYRVAIGSQDL